MKKAKMKTPVDRKNHPKSFKEAVLDHLKGTQKQVLSIKKDIRKIIVEEVTKQFDAKKIEFEGLYRTTVILSKLLQESGHITREDINKKYEELKAKNG